VARRPRRDKRSHRRKTGREIREFMKHFDRAMEEESLYAQRQITRRFLLEG
jgi:hypothetical protein